MSLSSILFGKTEKAKRLAPLKMTAEETFLMNYLMDMYMNKSNDANNPMGQYTKAMNKIINTKGVPINYNGKQISSIMPNKSMATLGSLAQERLTNQINPIMDMWKNMMTVRYNGTAAPGSTTPGLVNTLGPSMISSGQSGAMASGAGDLLSSIYKVLSPGAVALI